MKTIFLLFGFLSVLTGTAQEITNIVLVGPEGITDKIEKAQSFIVVKQFPDYYERSDYKKGGPCVKIRCYKDSNLTVLHGNYYEYRADGTTFRSGKYKDNKKHERWVTLNDTGKVISHLKYDNDVLIETVDLEKKDSVTKYDDEKESDFPGGQKAWSKYLLKSLEKKDGTSKAAKGGTVIVSFIVGLNGEVMDPHIYKSVEFFLDEDALEIVRKSPKWNPGWQNGHVVKSYKLQPIRFDIPE